MDKLKRFTTNKSLVDYIKTLGFKYYPTETKKKYYVNPEGKQVRIDYDFGIITFLNNRGNSVSIASSFTNVQINDFIKLNI